MALQWQNCGTPGFVEVLLTPQGTDCKPLPTASSERQKEGKMTQQGKVASLPLIDGENLFTAFPPAQIKMKSLVPAQQSYG